MSRIKEYLMDVEEGRIIPGELQEKKVCSDHFADKALRVIIAKEGHRGRCSYCGERRSVMDMPGFIRMVRGKLESEFENVDNACLPTEHSYFDDDDEKLPGLTRFHGYTAPSNCDMFDDTEDVVSEVLEITGPDGLWNDVVEALPQQAWISKDPFVASLDDELNIRWKHFADMVNHKQRFTFLANKEFDGHPSEYDNGLYDILTELGTMIHRFDVCKNIDENMSPAGISMFYGAFDEETARRESTPSTGHDGKGRFLIGQFRQKRPLFLIDLTSLPRPSFWHQNRGYREALAFMHIFHKEITKKIIPDDRIHTEYIPSQVFTEYLRYMFKLEGEISVDGLIYTSSVNGEKCVVLFCNQKESRKMLELVDVKDITI